MTRIEEVVGEALSKHSEVASIPGGYRTSFEDGITDLGFRQARSRGIDGKLACIAEVVTRYTPAHFPEFDAAAVARLNRRAAFGGFFLDDQGVGSRMTVSVYEDEPAENFIAFLLLQGFGHQMPVGFASAHSETSDQKFRAHRANLEYPRRWSAKLPPEAYSRVVEQLRGVALADFEAPAEPYAQVAVQFRGVGLVAMPGHDEMTIEVPLESDRPLSRMLDPTAVTALLRISTGTRHPMAGVGFMATLALPADPNDVTAWSARLNAAEHQLEDFVPRIGAWGARATGTQLVYSMFVPHDRGDVGMLAVIANWMVQRAAWLRDRWWIPGIGLVGEHGFR